MSLVSATERMLDAAHEQITELERDVNRLRSDLATVGFALRTEQVAHEGTRTRAKMLEQEVMQLRAELEAQRSKHAGHVPGGYDLAPSGEEEPHPDECPHRDSV